MESELAIAVHEIVRIYDAEVEARPHSAALKSFAGEELALALLVRYLESQGQSPQLLSHRATTGKAKGPRLDAWLKAGTPVSPRLYQVEVKMWSLHSLGGRPLALDASPKRVARFKRKTWEEYWGGRSFYDKPLNKLFTPMKPPPSVEHVGVEPLACLWPAMHPEGRPEPFFSVRTGRKRFPIVHVFSVSSFLRSLSTPELKLTLPSTSARLTLLRRVYPAA